MEGRYDYDSSNLIERLRRLGNRDQPSADHLRGAKDYTPATVIVDSPIVYEDAESGKWKPSNFEENFMETRLFVKRSSNRAMFQPLRSRSLSAFLCGGIHQSALAFRPSPIFRFRWEARGFSSELTQVYSLFPRLGKAEPILLPKF